MVFRIRTASLRFVILYIGIFGLAHTVVANPGPGDLSFEPYLFQTFNGQSIQAELGKLIVPENRSDPNSRLIELALVRFKSTSPNPGPPIVYLAGGPGGSGIETARGERFPLFMEFREIADVIALDQRGTGMSVPNLECPQRLALSLNRAYSGQEILAAMKKKVRDCVRMFQKHGTNLSGYNTNESADDLEVLRQALGVSKISLWGISYGTHLGLTAIRRHGSHIHRAVLAGVEGPDHTLKLPSNIQKQLQHTHNLILSDPAARQIVPDFLGWLQSFLERLQRRPITQNVFDHRSGKMVNVTFGEFEVRRLVAANIGRELTSLLPKTIHEMDRGNYTVIASAVLEERREKLGSAMGAAMDCASDASEKRWARILRETEKTMLGRAIDFPFPEICESVQVPDLGPEFRAPVASSVPVLLISGTFDQRTPPGNANEVRKRLPKAKQLIVVDGGHDDLFQSSPWIKQVMMEFFRNQPLSTTRIVLPPIQFAPVFQ